MCCVTVANHFNRRVEIPTDLLIAAVAPVAVILNAPFTAAVALNLHRNDKLRTVCMSFTSTLFLTPRRINVRLFFFRVQLYRRVCRE